MSTETCFGLHLCITVSINTGSRVHVRCRPVRHFLSTGRPRNALSSVCPHRCILFCRFLLLRRKSPQRSTANVPPDANLVSGTCFHVAWEPWDRWFRDTSPHVGTHVHCHSSECPDDPVGMQPLFLPGDTSERNFAGRARRRGFHGS